MGEKMSSVPHGTYLHKTDTPQHVAVVLLNAPHQGDPLPNRSLGVAEASHMGAGVWYVNRVWVQPKLQNKGMGSFLINNLKSLLMKKQDFKEMVVEPGGYSNRTKDQIRFYEQNEFRRVGDQYLWVWSLEDFNASHPQRADG